MYPNYNTEVIMALTHAKNTLKDSDSVKASSHIRVILALALSGLAELASLFFIQPLLPTLAVEYNVPVSQVSIILSAETALLAIGLLFTGTLSDHYGRKRLIIVSLLLGGVLTLLCPLVESWAMLVALRAVIGLALSGIAAAATAYISEEVAPVAAGIVTGYFVFGNSMGGMSGRIIASQLIDHISINTIFYGFAVSLIVVAILVNFLLPASRNFTPTQNLNVMRMVKGAASHFKNKNLALAFVISFIIFGAFTSLYNYLAFFLKGEPFHISPANAGLLSFSFALSFFTAPQAGRLSAKYGAMKVLRVLFLIMALGMLLTLTANVVTFIAGAVGHSFGALASCRLLQTQQVNVAGLVMVAPAEPAFFGLEEAIQPTMLSVPCILFASKNDPLMPFSRAQYWATCWGGHLIDIGEAGHINSESGYGEWQYGLERLTEFCEQL
ncbi:MFS transporter [Raoultella terrigena]|uniref:MFS transporter n=1 Tax=Raoultella terrigena TaxID=577 RepID=UPI003BF4DCE5